MEVQEIRSNFQDVFKPFILVGVGYHGIVSPSAASTCSLTILSPSFKKNPFQLAIMPDCKANKVFKLFVRMQKFPYI